MIGPGSLVRALFSLSYRPLAQCWARGGPIFLVNLLSRGGPIMLVRLLSFRPADPPTQYGAMVWVIGPLNIGTGL